MSRLTRFRNRMIGRFVPKAARAKWRIVSLRPPILDLHVEIVTLAEFRTIAATLIQSCFNGISLQMNGLISTWRVNHKRGLHGLALNHFVHGCRVHLPARQACARIPSPLVTSVYVAPGAWAQSPREDPWVIEAGKQPILSAGSRGFSTIDQPSLFGKIPGRQALATAAAAVPLSALHQTLTVRSWRNQRCPSKRQQIQRE